MLTIRYPLSSHPSSAIGFATSEFPTAQFPATRAQIASSLIGNLDKPFVHATDVQAHLDLLAVFHKVHHTIQEGGVAVDSATSLPNISAVQALFLARAEYRFDVWIEKVLQRPDRPPKTLLTVAEIPPVDVLMVLHAYMLNPWDYHEDSIRAYSALAGIGAFPLKLIHALIDIDTFELNPTSEQVVLWESVTSLAFDFVLCTVPKKAIICPRCTVVNYSAWVETHGDDASIFAVCTECGLAISSNALCVGKFLRDITSPRPLAHTLLDHNGVQDLESATNLSRAIKEILEISTATEGDRFAWKMVNVEEALLNGVRDGEPLQYRVKYILQPYNHPLQASFDLKSAVMRQGRFIKTMHTIQWAGKFSQFLQGKDDNILNAIVRYHQYFALSSEVSIPAVDIDLIFHTHQLSGSKYIKDCLTILGYILGHDDSITSVDIENTLSHDIEVWGNTYNTPYLQHNPGTAPSHCDGISGCRYCGMKQGHTPTCPNNVNQPRPPAPR